MVSFLTILCIEAVVIPKVRIHLRPHRTVAVNLKWGTKKFRHKQRTWHKCNMDCFSSWSCTVRDFAVSLYFTSWLLREGLPRYAGLQAWRIDWASGSHTSLCKMTLSRSKSAENPGSSAAHAVSQECGTAVTFLPVSVGWIYWGFIRL